MWERREGGVLLQPGQRRKLAGRLEQCGDCHFWPHHAFILTIDCIRSAGSRSLAARKLTAKCLGTNARLGPTRPGPGSARLLRVCARLLQIFPFIFRGLEERRSAEVVSLTPPAQRRISFAMRYTSLPPPPPGRPITPWKSAN